MATRSAGQLASRVRVAAPSVAATAALAAAALHLAVMPGQVAEWRLAAAASIAVAAGQIGLAGLLLSRRATTGLLLAGICGTVGTVALYVRSRTMGLPIGPVHLHAVGPVPGVQGDASVGVPTLPGSLAALHIQRIGALDMSRLLFELLLIALLVSLLPRRERALTTDVMLVLALFAAAVQLLT